MSPMILSLIGIVVVVAIALTVYFVVKKNKEKKQKVSRPRVIDYLEYQNNLSYSDSKNSIPTTVNPYQMNKFSNTMITTENHIKNLALKPRTYPEPGYLTDREQLANPIRGDLHITPRTSGTNVDYKSDINAIQNSPYILKNF